MTPPGVIEVDHPRFGRHVQLIGEQAQVGYTPLLGDPSARHGWNTPVDAATEEAVVAAARGLRVLEIGSGDGTAITLPTLAAPASEVVAIDVNRDLLEAVRRAAGASGAGSRLRTHLVPDSWWSQPAWVDHLAAAIGEVDLVARQPLQFGTGATLVNVLDLADRVLAHDGRLWMQNMSPYVGYIHELTWTFDFTPAPPGTLLTDIVASNRAFAEEPQPDLHPNGPDPEGAWPFLPLVRGFPRFMWFDEYVVRGALALASTTLTVQESFERSPSQIWQRNKLDVGPVQHRERELHVAWLGRTASTTGERVR